ncbi:MAG: DNA internalization-related competence protein ComEC/Rec2 [Eubacteriales bacterium]|nr:DNA internalization-related competence protein ComEC/Rec2 [Eubacteriales bacterium]
MKRPLAAICILNLTGTAVAIYIDSLEWVCAASVVVTLAIAAAVRAIGINRLYIVVLSLAFIVGALNFEYRNAALDESFKEYSGAKLIIRGMICSEPDIGERSTAYVLKVQYINDGETEKRTDCKAILRVPNSADGKDFDYGEMLEVVVSVELPKTARNPGGFDYRSYLAYKGISVLLKAEAAYVLRENGGNPLISLGFYLKQRIVNVIDACLPEQQAGLLNGMLIGYKEGLGPEVEEVFRKAGLSHIMAVSGANLVFLIAPLIFILKRIGIGRNYSNALVILAVLLFVLITGFEASVMRAALMAVIILLGGIIKRETDIITSIAAAALLLVLHNPFTLLDVGFQLSFTATLSLVLFSQQILSVLKTLKVFGKLNELIAATLAAQLGVIPISIYHFNSFSAISLLSNIIVVPLTGLVTVLGMCIAVIGQFLMPLASLISYFNCTLLSFILYVTDLSAKMPFSSTHMRTPSAFMIFLWYFMLFVLCSELQPMRKAFVFSASLILAVAVYALTPLPGLEIIHFDVEFGDSALITTGDGQAILIDAGGSSLSGSSEGEKVIIPYLRHKGIGRLDLIIATHAHNDHIGGLKDVIVGIKTERMAVSPLMLENEVMDDLTTVCRLRGTEVIVLSKGDRIWINEHIRLDILYPGTGGNDYSLNNQSLVIKLSYMEAEFLFTGDIEEEAEKVLIDEDFDLSSDVLKVAHHGSNSSSTDVFMERVSPLTAIISVGRNSFGHPAPRTLQMLEQFNATAFRTDLHGAISIATDGHTIKVSKMVD